MATDVRDFPETPDYQSANAAIDMVLAQQSMKDKGRRLRSQVRQAENEYRSLSARELARGRMYEQGQKGTTSSAKSVSVLDEQMQAASARLEELRTQWGQQAVDAVEGWSVDFAAKEKFATLQGAQRQQAWDAFYERRAQRLEGARSVQAQVGIIESMQRQRKQQYQSYQQQRDQATRYRERYEGMRSKAQKTYSRYQDLRNRYEAHAKFVPWSP